MKNDLTSEKFNAWLDGGRKDESIVSNYVGVLSIGHNTSYDLDIDFTNARVSELTLKVKQGPFIPDLTNEDRENTVMIALNNPQLKELLKSKGYVVAPESRISVWHTSNDHRKIGAGIEIWLDKVYLIDYDCPFPEYDETKYPNFPHYRVITENRKVETQIISVLVDLEQNSVVGIIPFPVSPKLANLQPS